MLVIFVHIQFTQKLSELIGLCKSYFAFAFSLYFVFIFNVARKTFFFNFINFYTDICDRCIPIEECPMFAHMKKQEQQMWLEQVPCDGAHYNGGSPVFGFSSVAKGDYVNQHYNLFN